MCVCVNVGSCVHVVYRADLYSVFGPKAVRSSALVCGCELGTCMLECVWYTELTCIPYSGLYRIRADIVGQVLDPSV